MSAFPLAALLALSALAYDQGKDAFEERLLHAPWEDRLRVVRTAAGQGPDGRELLEIAARDADWQVRAAAAQGLGGVGPQAQRALLLMAAEDTCHLVRLAAAHSLGRLGATVPPVGEGDARECVSAYLTSDEIRTNKAVKARDSTRPDAAGCSYLRMQRLGKAMCPSGLTVHGIGRPPESPKLLKVRGEEAGVALCCPSDDAVAPTPVEVECRLIPEECPEPWQQMDEPADGHFGKEGRYRRSQRHHLGDLDWVQCCRPVPTEAVEEPAAAPPAAVVDRRRRPPVVKAVRPVDEKSPPRTEGPSPESLIARRALEKLAPPAGPPSREVPPVDSSARFEDGKHRETNLKLEPPTSLGKPEVLPPPGGPDAHEEDPVTAAARTEKNAHTGPDGTVDAGTTLGRREGGLAAPQGPQGRLDPSVAGTPDIMPDGGLKRAAHNPLPLLLEKLSAPEPALRARAAEMIGAMGAAGRPAAKALLAVLGDENPRVRSDAALALGSVTSGSDLAVTALKRLLKDPHPDVRYSAAAALGRVGTPAAQRAFSRYLTGESRGMKRRT